MGTYKSLAASAPGVRLMHVMGWFEQCQCCGKWDLSRHGENGPFEIVDVYGRVLGTSADLVEWQDGVPVGRLS